MLGTLRRCRRPRNRCCCAIRAGGRLNTFEQGFSAFNRDAGGPVASRSRETSRGVQPAAAYAALIVDAGQNQDQLAKHRP